MYQLHASRGYITSSVDVFTAMCLCWLVSYSFDLMMNLFFRLLSSQRLIPTDIWSVREAVSYRGLFTAGWFGVREKRCFRLKIYDRLQASEQADGC